MSLIISSKFRATLSILFPAVMATSPAADARAASPAPEEDLQKLARYVESKYAIDLKPADLRFEIPSGEPIPNGYTLLDLVFVAATSPERRRNWADTYKILRVTLEYAPRLTPLSVTGQNLL